MNAGVAVIFVYSHVSFSSLIISFLELIDNNWEFDNPSQITQTNRHQIKVYKL